MRIIERGTSNLISISENSVDVAIFSVASLIACQTLGYVLIKILFSRPKKGTGRCGAPVNPVTGRASAPLFFLRGECMKLRDEMRRTSVWNDN